MTEAVAAFDFIIQNVPIWINSLDDLNKSIKERQAQAAKIASEVEGADQAGPRRKIKKSGSNESIRPRSAHGLHHDAPDEAPVDRSQLPSSQQPTLEDMSHGVDVSNNVEGLRQIITRKRKKQYGAVDAASFVSTSDSFLINNGSATLRSKHRSRSMIIVYYDSEIQKAFENLVRNIGNARNGIRKARTEKMRQLMLGNVGNIGVKSPRLKSPDPFNESFGSAVVSETGSSMPGSALGGSRSPVSMVRSPKSAATGTNVSGRSYSRSGLISSTLSPDPFPSSAGGACTDMAMKSPHMTTVSAPSTKDSTADSFSEVDTALDTAQSLCERGAFTFLREGECEAEISGARNSFEKARTLANQELASLKAEQEAKSQAAKARAMEVDSSESTLNNTLSSGNSSGAVGPQLLEVDDETEADKEEEEEDLDALLAMPHSRFRLTAKT